MSKVAIVGVEGSGKTVLMGALCECYKQGAGDEPYLFSENQAAFMFKERIPHLLREQRHWPEATTVDSLKSMKWTLRMGNEILEEIEMLDYPGELYRIAFGEHTKAEADAHRAELDEFLAHLTEADVLAVLVNPEDIKNIGADAKKMEAAWITRGIFEFTRQLPKLKRKLLVFTQADRYKEELKAAGGPKGLYAQGLPEVKTLFPNLQVISITAVSGTDSEGRPAQGYSTVGCLEFMREIFWERDQEVQRCLELCAGAKLRVRNFREGGIKEFNEAFVRYGNSVDKLRLAVKPLQQIYGICLELHQTEVKELQELVADIKPYGAKSIYELAKAATWGLLKTKYVGCESIFDAFRRHYQSRVEIDLRRVEEDKRKAEAEAQESLQACEKALINVYRSSAKGLVAFYDAVNHYSSCAQDFASEASAFRDKYNDDLEWHKLKEPSLLRLAKSLKIVCDKKKLKVLAKPETWLWLRREYEGESKIFDGLLSYYVGERRKETNNIVNKGVICASILVILGKFVWRFIGKR